MEYAKHVYLSIPSLDAAFRIRFLLPIVIAMHFVSEASKYASIPYLDASLWVNHSIGRYGNLPYIGVCGIETRHHII